jgi:hypothetical protein
MTRLRRREPADTADAVFQGDGEELIIMRLADRLIAVGVPAGSVADDEEQLRQAFLQRLSVDPELSTLVYTALREAKL